MLRTGVDLIEINRVAQAIDRFGDLFLGRVYTSHELESCRGRVESLAARFAAKEAVSKALGTGVWRDGIRWQDIEVVRNAQSGAPILHLHAAATRKADVLRLDQWSISLSHDRTHAIAFAVATDG